MLQMLPLLSHVLQKYGEAWKAWEYFKTTSAEHGISMETMGHHLFIILSSMEKHGKQGTAFVMISNSMGSMGTPFFMSSSRVIRNIKA